MEFLSVCSGIEAASVAWEPLGWRAIAFAEVAPFPKAVLAHHYPTVPNLGDMTTIARRVLTGEVEAADVLCGGTPCQAFSVAGLRESLADARGNLTLKFVELANAIDYVRARDGKPEVIVFWENVPGVLSTKDNAFGCFLAGLAGEDEPLQPPGKKWANAGAVYGPSRAVAWRTLDAQYFGVAQRRRRVFVVASARAGFDPATVLFEWDGLRRDSAPSRKARETAPTIPSRSSAGGGLGTDFDCDGGLVAGTLQAGGKAAGSATQQDAESGLLVSQPHASVSPTIKARDYKGPSSDGDGDGGILVPMLAHALTGEGFDASEDGSGRGTPLVPVHFQTRGSNLDLGQHVTGTLSSNSGSASGSAPCIAFDCKASGQAGFGIGDIASTMRAMGHAESHQNGGGHQAVAYTTKLHNTQSNQAGKIYEEYTVGLDRNSPPPALLTAMQVRRLMPEECEALQGFERGYTRIPSWTGWRKMDATETPESCAAEGMEVRQSKKTGKWSVKDVDGPRYKALGNSWAVPNIHWLGRRIDARVRALDAGRAVA